MQPIPTILSDASTPLESALRPHLLALLDAATAAGGSGSLYVTNGVYAVEVLAGPVSVSTPPIAAAGSVPALAGTATERSRAPTVRERILDVLADEPHKQIWYARKINHEYDSYFRRQFAILAMEGLVVRDQAGGWRKPRQADASR